MTLEHLYADWANLSAELAQRGQADSSRTQLNGALALKLDEIAAFRCQHASDFAVKALIAATEVPAGCGPVSASLIRDAAAAMSGLPTPEAEVGVAMQNGAGRACCDTGPVLARLFDELQEARTAMWGDDDTASETAAARMLSIEEQASHLPALSRRDVSMKIIMAAGAAGAPDGTQAEKMADAWQAVR